MASRLTVTITFHRAAPMTKTDLIFPAFSSRFVDFAVQFSFRCTFSFNEERSLLRSRFFGMSRWEHCVTSRKRLRRRIRGATLQSGLTVARFFSTNHNSLLRTATNEITSFCIDQITLNGLSCKAGSKGQLLRYVEIF